MDPTPSVAVLDPRRGLGRWREAWDALVERQPLPSPFQRSWWLASAAPDTTYALVVEGDVLVGGLALRSRRIGVTRYLAPGPEVLCPDHLDVLAEPGAERVVVAALADWLGSRPGLLDVRGVVADSLLERVVGVAAEPGERAPYQPLDGGYLAGRSAAFRRSVRRGARRLERLGLTHRRVEPGEVPVALARFRDLHDARGDRGALLAELARLESAVHAGVRAGEARVDVIDGRLPAVAVSIGFEVAGRLSLYQVARSMDREHGSAGTVLLASVIEDAATRGLREVDLLRGDEAYKSSFADRARVLGRVRAAQGAPALVQLRAEDSARRLSARLRSPAGSGA